MITKNSGIIFGAMVFKGNPYDGRTLRYSNWSRDQNMMGRLPKVALVDRCLKSRRTILRVEIMVSDSCKGKTSYEKLKGRALFSRRAAVEPVIGHLKIDYRMLRNYPKGAEDDMLNTIMAAEPSI